MELVVDVVVVGECFFEVEFIDDVLECGCC